jgi:hypothetical protein
VDWRSCQRSKHHLFTASTSSGPTPRPNNLLGTDELWRIVETMGLTTAVMQYMDLTQRTKETATSSICMPSPSSWRYACILMLTNRSIQHTSNGGGNSFISNTAELPPPPLWLLNIEEPPPQTTARTLHQKDLIASAQTQFLPRHHSPRCATLMPMTQLVSMKAYTPWIPRRRSSR